MHPAPSLSQSGGYQRLIILYSFGEEGVNCIVTVQTSKFFSVIKNSKIAQVRTRMPILPIERVLKIVTLKNFDGCTSCMPSSPKVYIRPCWYAFLGQDMHSCPLTCGNGIWNILQDGRDSVGYTWQLARMHSQGFIQDFLLEGGTLAHDFFLLKSYFSRL